MRLVPKNVSVVIFNQHAVIQYLIYYFGASIQRGNLSLTTLAQISVPLVLPVTFDMFTASAILVCKTHVAFKG